MSPLNVRQGLLALALFGAVSAIEEASTVELSSIHVPATSEELLLFDKPGW